MEHELLFTPSIAASGTRESTWIPLIRARSLSVTVRCTYNASATSAARVYFYYSPDTKNWDTVAFAYFDVTLTAGSTIQETKVSDVPEHGYMKFAVYNQDTSYAVTNVGLWFSIQSHPKDSNGGG